jgi:tetratricopeptide (TPR) repeat protein
MFSAHAALHAPRRSTTTLICLALAALTFLVFGHAVGFGFIGFDDNVYVDQNAALTAGLSARGLAWAFTANLTHLTNSAEYWEPLTLLTRLADYQCYGFAPRGHHVTSIVLHLAAGLALFGALRQLTGAFWRSAAVATLFLVHPMHVEPVCWLSARKDIVSGLFYVLTLWAYGWHAAQPSLRRAVVLVAAFLAANMAKPMAVSLPFVMLLLDFWPLGKVRFAEQGWRNRAWRLVLAKVPFLIVSAAVSVLAYVVQRHVGAVAEDELLPFPYRVGCAVIALGNYLLKAFVPTGLTLFYPHPGRNLDLFQVIAAGCGLLLLTLVALHQSRRRPWLIVGWGWFLVVLAPVSGLIQIGDQSMADRYSYLSYIGLFIAAVWQIGEWLASPRKAAALAIAVVLAFAALAFQQAQTWRSDITVFSHALAVTDDNYLAHFNLGAALLREGHQEEARQHFGEASRIRRPFLEYQLAAAEAALARGSNEEAINRLATVMRLMPWDSNLHQMLGTLLVKSHEPGRALVQFNEALKYHPNWNEPRLSIAEVLLDQGQPDRAAAVLRDALSLEPGHPRALTLLKSATGH